MNTSKNVYNLVANADVELGLVDEAKDAVKKWILDRVS